MIKNNEKMMTLDEIISIKNMEFLDAENNEQIYLEKVLCGNGNEVEYRRLQEITKSKKSSLNYYMCKKLKTK